MKSSPDWISRFVPVSQNTDSPQPRHGGVVGIHLQGQHMNSRQRRISRNIATAGIQVQPVGKAFKLVGVNDRVMLVGDLSIVSRCDIDYLAGGRWNDANMGYSISRPGATYATGP